MLYSSQNQLVLAIILASFVIYVVHVFVFPLYDATPHPTGEYRTLLSLEKSLCKSNLKTVKIPPAWKNHCPRDGIVTVVQGGRLGNQMWEYASVWALARRTGLEGYVPRCISRTLGEVFEHLSVPPLAYVGHCPAPREMVRGLEFWNNTEQSILLPIYITLPELVLTWVVDIRKEFSFKRPLKERAQRKLAEAAENGKYKTFVGVHVRRTDYKNYLSRTRNVTLVEPSYFLRAMKYFERKYNSVVFVVLSDDPTWCQEHVMRNRSNVKIFSDSESSAAKDLALLASCNHSIIDYGTFGEWGAILAGGETLIYNLKRRSTLKDEELLPNWKVFH